MKAISALRAIVVGAVSATVLIVSPTVSHAKPPAKPAPSRPTSAVTYQENARHDGHIVDPAFTTHLHQTWRRALHGRVAYPLIVGPRVFVDVAHPSGGYGTAVEALSLATGKVVWGPKDIGGTYQAGSIAYGDHRLFALNYDGRLRAFNAVSGHRIWSVSLPHQYQFLDAPVAFDGTLYVAGSGVGGTLYSVDEATGDLRWMQSTDGDIGAPAVDTTGAYVSSVCGQAEGFALLSQRRWFDEGSCTGGGHRLDVLHDGLDYVRDDDPNDPGLVLSAQTGTEVGTFTSTTAPAFSGTTMITSSHGTITAIDLSTESTLWSKSEHFTAAPIIVNDDVVAGAGDGKVRLLNLATGSQDWHGVAGGKIGSPDEQNAKSLVGLAEAQGYLAVPNGHHLTVYGGR